jgi:hypothetical protein
MEARFDATGVMLRPTRSDGCVRRRAAEMALPAVKRWLGGDSWFHRDSDLIEDLMKHIGQHDGFHIVTSMEDSGWAPDDSLVEIMRGGFIADALREMVRQWVLCLGVKLELPIGTKVRWGHYIAGTLGPELIEIQRGLSRSC